LGTRNRCQSRPVWGRRNRGIDVVVPAMIAVRKCYFTWMASLEVKVLRL
jgi:hypothetical protein